MATTNICRLCQKGTRMAGGYSNRVRATKFNPTGNKRKYPNLQWVALPKTMGGGRMKICTRCMKAGKQLEMTKPKAPTQKERLAKKG
ncbi:MAG: L28 family ribosomal protein [bacterium]|nr:L28 family ribosomal protein [bacterium]